MPRQSDPLSLVTPEAIEAYARDGAVWLPGLLSADWLALIERGVERNIANPGPLACWHFAGEPGEFWNDYCNYRDILEYRELLASSPIARVVATLLRSRRLWLFFDQIFVKRGRHGERTPWHQDAQYWMADGVQCATMWIALEPLSEAETLEFVAGSHRRLYRPPNVTGSGAFVRPDRAPPDEAGVPPQWAGAPVLPDIESRRGDWPIVSRASRPGDVLLFHPATVRPSRFFSLARGLPWNASANAIKTAHPPAWATPSHDHDP